MKWAKTFMAGAMLAVLLAALPARAATVTWVTAGPSTNDWFDTNNWSTLSIPAAGDDVIINNNNVGVLLTNSTAALSSILLTNKCTLIFSNWDTALSATNVSILSNASMTCVGAFTNNAMSNRVYLICSNLTIAANGTINVDFKGWAGAADSASTTSGNGPGGGGWTTTPSTYAGGGGYGGRGGNVTVQAIIGGITYGSETAPLNPGSGGAVYYVSGTAGAGGGAVRIAASGAVTINGTISASGQAGSMWGGAPGSGGGIYITCTVFAGTNGAVTADGGDDNFGNAYGTSAGGGRIAVVYTNVASPKPTVRFSAKAGAAGDGVGDLGTLYFTDTSILDGTWFPHSGRLVIPGSNAWSPASLTVTNGSCRLPQGGFQLTVASNLTVQGSSTKLEIGGTDFAALVTNYSSGTTSAPLVTVGGNLIVTNGATLCVYAAATNASTAHYGARVSISSSLVVAANSSLLPYSDCTNGGSVYIEAGAMTVATAGSINADWKGYVGALYYVGAGFGPGRGSAAAGAGYGGKGGDGSSPSTAGGSTYGLSNAPTEAGSGGGSQYSSMAGGTGGGLVWLEANGAIAVNGTISANGTNDIGTGAGGGSGGGIYMRCRSFSGTGMLAANGGTGGITYGGGGGGGRIAVWRMYSSGTVTTSVSGGTASYNGTNGTVFWGWFPVPGTIFTMH